MPTTNNASGYSKTMTLTVPALPRNIIRLRSPPISEMSNDGSSIAGPRVYPDSESADVILQDADATTIPHQINLPTSEMTGDVANEGEEGTPPPRLTTHNLEKQQEEIEYAVVGSSAPAILAPVTAQVQGISPPTPTWTEVFENHERQIREWRQYPDSVDKPASLSELAKPLYKGVGLPNIPEASKLIWEQMELEEAEAIAAHHVPRRPKEIRYIDLSRRAPVPSPAAQETPMVGTKAGMRPLRKRRWTAAMESSQRVPPGQLLSETMGPRAQTEQPNIQRPDIARGRCTPAEVQSSKLDRDEHISSNNSASENDSDSNVEQQLILGETPFLQALISDQIKSDLAYSRKKADGEETTWERTMPATIKFALPRAPVEEVLKAEALFKALCYQEVEEMVTAIPAASRKRKAAAQ